MKPFRMILAVSILFIKFLTAQQHSHPMDAHLQVGRVSFQTSCSPAARESINRGLSLFYSFWYDEARKSFVEAARLDPRCAVAYWGQAISYYQPVETLPEGNQLRDGREAIIRAQSAVSQSRRERGYIEALQFIFNSDSEPGVRAMRYSDAMGKLAAAYPQDNVAAVLFALSLLSPGLPDDPDHIRSRKAVTILNAILKAEPDNPGVTHFIIHACDNPAMARYGLEAAHRYAKIAPASAHALHMPSHIFARLGHWQDDIQSNLASKAAAENVSMMHTGAQHRFHAMEFLQYAYLQTGREDKARAIADEAQTIEASELDPGFESYYGWVQESLKVRFALETRDWPGAMELRPNSGADVFVQRLNYWARAIAAGHLKNRAAAEMALEGYEGTFSEAELLEATKNHVAQLAETRAWTLFAQGDPDAAVALLSPIADHQDKVGKGEVELPAREMMGDMFRLANRPDASIREYRISLETDPGRFNTLLHAGEVAQNLGLRGEATRYYHLLLSNASDPAPESEKVLKPARAFLEAR